MTLHLAPPSFFPPLFLIQHHPALQNLLSSLTCLQLLTEPRLHGATGENRDGARVWLHRHGQIRERSWRRDHPLGGGASPGHGTVRACVSLQREGLRQNPSLFQACSCIYQAERVILPDRWKLEICRAKTFPSLCSYENNESLLVHLILKCNPA